MEHDGILVIGTCPGTGDYEGLTYVFQHTSDVFEDGTDFHGVIYEGDPSLAELEAARSAPSPLEPID